MKLVMVYLIISMLSDLSAQTLSFNQSNLINHSTAINKYLRSNTDTSEIQMPESKSPYVAFTSSLLLPGFGQFYNEQVEKGFAFLFGISFSTALLFQFADEAKDDENEYATPLLLLDCALLGVLYIWQLIDAPISSGKINRERKSKIDLMQAVVKNSYGATLKFYF